MEQYQQYIAISKYARFIEDEGVEKLGTKVLTDTSTTFLTSSL